MVVSLDFPLRNCLSLDGRFGGDVVGLDVNVIAQDSLATLTTSPCPELPTIGSGPPPTTISIYHGQCHTTMIDFFICLGWEWWNGRQLHPSIYPFIHLSIHQLITSPPNFCSCNLAYALPLSVSISMADCAVLRWY